VNDTLKFILGIAGALITLYIIWYFSDIVAYIAIAAVLSLIGAPVVDIFKTLRFKNFGMPDWLASLLTIVSFFLLIAGVVSLFVPLVVEQANIVMNIDYNEVQRSLRQPIQSINDFADRFMLNNEEGLTFVDMMVANLQNLVETSQVFDIFNSILGFTGDFILGLFAVVFILFFFLKEENMFDSLVLAITPDKHENKVVRIINTGKEYLSRYFIGVISQISIIATLVSIFLWLIGIENALLIGFFAGLVNLIPYIGPIIGALFGLIVAATTNLDMSFYTEMLPMLGGVAAVFLVVQLLDNAVFQPFIFSNSVKAHPVEIFVVILIAAKLGGARWSYRYDHRDSDLYDSACVCEGVFSPV